MIHSEIIHPAQFNNAFDINNIEDMQFASMEQSHSNIFKEVNKPGIYKSDALITNEKNLVLVVKTADCMPVIISDHEKVGIVHIGWKGLENKIFNKTISKFNISKLKVSIGPHAQKCCYEVKEDLETKFKKNCVRKENKIYLDLSKGIKEFCYDNKIDIEVSDVCTIENKSYHSYRRDKTKSRQWSLVWI